MKKIICISFILFCFGCNLEKKDNVEIKRSLKNYKVFFQDSNKDSVILHFPIVFTIKNKSINMLRLDFIKSKPQSFLGGNFTINKKGELDILNEKIFPEDSLDVVFFVSKLYSKKDMQEYLPFENFKDYKANFKKFEKNKPQILSNDSIKKYIEEIQKDSIYFQFINQDKTIWFLKCGTIEGKTFITDDKSNNKIVN